MFGTDVRVDEALPGDDAVRRVPEADRRDRVRQANGDGGPDRWGAGAVRDDRTRARRAGRPGGPGAAAGTPGTGGTGGASRAWGAGRTRGPGEAGGPTAPRAGVARGLAAREPRRTRRAARGRELLEERAHRDRGLDAAGTEDAAGLQAERLHVGLDLLSERHDATHDDHQLRVEGLEGLRNRRRQRLGGVTSSGAVNAPATAPAASASAGSSERARNVMSGASSLCAAAPPGASRTRAATRNTTVRHECRTAVLFSPPRSAPGPSLDTTCRDHHHTTSDSGRARRARGWRWPRDRLLTSG